MEFKESKIYNNVFVSPDGTIRKGERVLTPTDNNKVHINNENIFISILVVDAFIMEYSEVQKKGLKFWHKDGNKKNNSVENLQLVTQQELNKLLYENRSKVIAFRVKLKNYSKQFRRDVDNFIKNYDPSKLKD
jgi:hypothetical protein